jgi:histidinol-phosphatase
VQTELTFAFELADAADAITMARFRAHDLWVETKPDLTPVSEADRAVEEALRARIDAERPKHAVLGEEFGSSGEVEPIWRWIIDPIDGTKNYVRGIPIFATLLALEHEGRLELGVVSAPALGRRWWASRGGGAFADREALRVSGVRALADAHLSYDDIRGFEQRGLEKRFVALARRCWRSRGFGDFWSHVLVAEGAIDVAVEPSVNLWDLAPLRVIVEEAGGCFTDLTGEHRIDGGSVVSSNGWLHDEVLAALGDSKE